MSLAWRVLVVMAVSVAASLAPTDGYAEPGNCPNMSVSLIQVSADCEWAYSEYSASASSGDGHTWVVTIQCGNGGICVEHVECVEGGQAGYVHDVYMDGQDVGDVCVPQEAVQEVDIRQLAIREFRRLQWPSSELTVQPPGGKTLVNLETIFYTTNSEPIPKTVPLAGRSVTIEATPTSYTWHFGDETSETTTSPGRPHPNHDVFHVYTSTGDVAPSVSTTYSGRFRIGNGNWQEIPETLTVDGPAVGLTILEAKPQLVIR